MVPSVCREGFGRSMSPARRGSAFVVRPLRAMQIMPTSGNEHRSLLLISFETYAVLSPLLLVALMNTRLQSIWVVHVICFFCLMSSAVLLTVAFSQLSTQSRKGMISSFIFAGIALFWIFFFEILLPSLARSK